MEENILLEIRDLQKTFTIRNTYGKKAYIRAVDGISLSIRKGETFGLVGESGCGKSTLGRCILRLTEPDSGAIFYDGKDITACNMRPYRKKMQIVFQDPAGSLDPRMKAGDIIGEALKVASPAMRKDLRWEKAMALMERVELRREQAYRYPHEFSGGQQQRIGIARALAVEPEFIVCDEAVLSLDVSIQAQIINLLTQLKEEMGLTYLFIAHDLSMVRQISRRVAVMYLGALMEYGDADRIFKAPLHPYTRGLIAAVPRPDPRYERARKKELMVGEATGSVNPGPGCRFAPRCPETCPQCFEARPQLRDMGDGRAVACHRR